MAEVSGVTVTNSFVSEPKIEVTKTATPTSNVAKDGVVTYTVTVTNAGNNTLHGITLEDTLVENIELDKDELKPGESASTTYRYVATQGDVDAGVINNAVTATGATPDNDIVKGSDTATVTTVDSEAKLTVTKTADPAEGVAVGDTVTYTITVSNDGNVTVTGLTLAEQLEGVRLGALDKTTLAPGETATATATYVVKQSDVDSTRARS